jgi:ABC-type transporter Mla MlaB component
VSTIKEIQCGQQLTIAQVSDLYAQLLAALVEGQAVNIHINEVERVDTAGLQLLYTFKQNAQTGGVVVMWTPPSTVFADASDTLGLGEFYLDDE